MSVEYRVKAVTRYIVTRHETSDTGGSTRQIGGEHDNPDVAYEVGYALARQEAENLGLPPGDGRIQYPARQPPVTTLSENQIAHMANRFLGWRLPPDFNPDAGISFEPNYNQDTPWPAKHEPVGTNLFTFVQTKAMIRHMAEGLPAE